MRIFSEYRASWPGALLAAIWSVCSAASTFAWAEVGPVPNATVPAWMATKVAALVGIQASRGQGTDGTAATSTGTGFWISSRYIMTAKHLVTSNLPAPCADPSAPMAPVNEVRIWKGRPDRLKTQDYFLDTASIPSRVIPIPESDIAVLDVGPDQPPATLPIDAGVSLVQGDPISTRGFGGGDAAVPIRGVVLLWETTSRGFMKAAMSLQAGFSGAPIFDQSGDVVALDSCGTQDAEFLSKVALAEGFLEANSIPSHWRPSKPRDEDGIVTPSNNYGIKGAVEIYPPGNGSTAPHHPALANEAIVQVRGAIDLQWLAEGATQDGGQFQIAGINIDGTAKVLLHAIDKADAGSQGNSWSYVSKPIVADLSSATKPISVELWDRTRYYINTIISADDGAASVRQHLPACLRSPSSVQRAACLTANPHALDSMATQIDAVRADYYDVLNNLSPQDADIANKVSQQFANFLDAIGDPCHAVLVLVPRLPLPAANAQSDYVPAFTSWTTACLRTPGAATDVGVSDNPIDKAIWAIQTIKTGVGSRRADTPNAADPQIVIAEMLTAFESVATADYTAGQQIARNDTLSGLFDYFMDSWANPACAQSFTDGGADELQTTMSKLRKAVAAGKCHAH